MILNPIAIATQGVYANDIAISRAAFGYVDVDSFVDIYTAFDGNISVISALTGSINSMASLDAEVELMYLLDGKVGKDALFLANNDVLPLLNAELVVDNLMRGTITLEIV